MRNIARNMVTQWGFSKARLGAVAWEMPNGNGGFGPNAASPETEKSIDEEVSDVRLTAVPPPHLPPPHLIRSRFWLPRRTKCARTHSQPTASYSTSSRRQAVWEASKCDYENDDVIRKNIDAGVVKSGNAISIH